MVKLIRIDNVFDPINTRHIEDLFYTKQTVSELIPKDVDVVVNIDGINITDYNIVIKDNSQIIVAPILGKGSGKQILGIIAMIAVAAFAPYATNAILGNGFIGGTTGWGFGSYVLNGAVMAAGSMLVSAVLPPQQLDMGNLQGMQQSQTYGWNGAKTLPQIGTPIPILYGTHALYGNIISRKVETVGDDQYLYMLLALCEGEIENIKEEDIFLNDNPIVNYEDVEWWYRNGTINQDVIPNFGDVETPNNFQTKCDYNVPQTHQTIGNALDAARIKVSFPYGLYYANDKGSFDEKTVKFKVEYRKVGDTTWTTKRTSGKVIDHYEYEHYEYYNSWGGDH